MELARAWPAAAMAAAAVAAVPDCYARRHGREREARGRREESDGWSVPQLIGGDATPPLFEVSCWSNEITSSPPI